MTLELAEHISLMAAPIYAGMLAPFFMANAVIDAKTLDTLRKRAITHALALWLQTLDTPEAAPQPVRCHGER